MTPPKKNAQKKSRGATKKPPKKRSLPLVSSDQVVAALRRLGFEPAHTKGSHMTMKRPRTGGGTDVTTVVLGKKQVPRGTLESILKLANVSADGFRASLK